jgi:hypothetical protein
LAIAELQSNLQGRPSYLRITGSSYQGGRIIVAPAPSTELWDITSTYDSGTRWKAPAFKPELGNFGLSNGTTLLDLTMQLEQGGLRAIARWKWRETPAARR